MWAFEGASVKDEDESVVVEDGGGSVLLLIVTLCVEVLFGPWTCALLRSCCVSCALVGVQFGSEDCVSLT